MKLGITLAGWIAFLAAIVAILVLRAENHRLAARVAEVEDSIDTQTIDTEGEDLVPKEPPTAAYQTTDEYKDRAEKAEEALEELKALNASLTQKAEEAQRIDEKKETPKTRGRKDLSESSEERQAWSIEAERRAADKNVQRRYGLFLSNLDESIATQARAILSGILPRSERHLGSGDYDQRIRDAMAEILSPGEMQAFEEYEDMLPEMLMRQDYDAEIARMAPELSLESRNLLVDALIEEVFYATDGAIESRYEDLAAYIDTMIAARDRLHEILPEDELPAATRYFDMRIGGMEGRLLFPRAGEEASTEDTPK